MAEQTARNWSSGDIVTAANLSSIEKGVSTLAEDYTPTTWANGDTVTAVALNKIEQGIVDGSSSDFSTAQVTVINNLSADVPAYIIGVFIVNDVLVRQGEFEQGTSTKTCVLYKNLASVYPDEYENVSVSGNATIGEDDNVSITGDCTITISDSSSGGSITY